MEIIDPLVLSDPAFLSFLCVAMILIGPCLGSFASAIAYRAPRQESWVFASVRDAGDGQVGARSVCPHCRTKLKWYELLPLVSWIGLRGKCRTCGHKISAVYPTLELAAMVASVALLYALGPSYNLILSLMALPFLLALFAISWNRAMLPDQLLAVLFSLAIVMLGIKALYAEQAGLIVFDKLAGLAAGLIFGGMLWGLRTVIFRLKVDMAGEFKLLAVAGLWFGFAAFPVFLIMAGLYGFCRAVLRLARANMPQPGMGHAFVAGFLIAMVTANQILAQLGT